MPSSDSGTPSSTANGTATHTAAHTKTGTTTQTAGSTGTGTPASVVTGVGTASPRLASAADLLGTGPAPDGTFDPADVLGRKGLRYKDRATCLALAAARLALDDAGLRRAPEDGPDDRFAVAVSSNLGNLDTVCAAAGTIAAEGVTALSPMDLPNASSNVIASTLAIRFGLRGVNLMVCNGATSGLDALRWAGVLIAGGRADRVLVVGVEVVNDVVAALAGPGPLFEGAAAVVVESAPAADRRGAVPRLRLAGYRRGGASAPTAGRVADRPVDVWFTADPGTRDRPARLLTVPVLDLGRRVGQASGALGVLQCAAAAAWLARAPGSSALATAGTDTDDASASMLFTPAASPRSEGP